MRTQMIHMLQSTYPFGQSGDPESTNRILIKQTLPKHASNFTEIMRLSKLSKKLSENNIFIKLQTILQEEQSLCLLYEYVPIKVSKYIKAMDEKFLKQYRHLLYEIAEILAENRVITTIDMENMGLNEKYEAKYFLGVHFVQKKQVNIYQLKNDYVEEIKKIFAPYLNSGLVSPKKTSKNLVKVENRLSDTQEIQNISSYIDPNNNLVKTRKHQSIYYQKDHDKQINKRKQSYMSSVSNLRLNNLYKRINEIQLQVCNTKSPTKSGFKFSIEGREFTSKSSIDKKTVNSSNVKTIANRASKNENNHHFSAILPKNNSNLKYNRYENQQEKSEQQNLYEEYQKSIKSSKPHHLPITTTLDMSAHTKPHSTKNQHKKFSTQFASLSDFQQPLMALTNAMRISANGLDKQQRKINKKIQMFKERQYSEIKSISGNTNYMRDFMSVLQEETSTNERTSKHNENENQSQEGDLSKQPQLKIGSQESIEDVDIHQLRSQQLHKPYRPTPFQQPTLTSYSHTYLPSPQHIITPLAQSNQTIENKIKTKTSIQHTISNTNIHSRVKGVIENSKKLIEKLKEKAKKNF